MKKTLFSLSALILALSASPALLAQTETDNKTPTEATTTTQPAQAEQMSMPQSSDYSDREVSRFAQASAKVQDIQAEYGPQLQASTDNQEKFVQLQEEAQEKMIDAVQGAGLSVDKFNEIIHVARLDEQLAQRIQAQLP